MFRILSKANILHRIISFKNDASGFRVRTIFLKNHNRSHSITLDPKIEQKFKLIDKISIDFRLVYRDHEFFNKLIVCTYNASWLIVALGIYVVGQTYYADLPEKEKTEKEIINISEKTKALLVAITGLTFSVVCVLVSKMFPLRIYHHKTQKLYKVVFPGILWNKEVVTFNEGTLVPVFEELMNRDLVKIKFRLAVFDKDCFKSQSVLEEMFGKPK